MARVKQVEKLNKQIWVIGGLVVLVIVAAFWVGRLTTEIKLLKSTKTGTEQQIGGGQLEAAVATVLPDEDWQKLLGDPAAEQGNKDALITIVEFVDYQCPFCKRAFEQTYPELKQQYVDTGKVRWLMRDLPLSIHSNAPAAALSARCAGEQDKYWQMHDQLFAKQDEWSNLANPDDKLGQYVAQLGLNIGQFRQCYAGKKYEAQVKADEELAGKVGATGTPTFFINGQTLVGAQPLSAFTKVIEAELVRK